MPAGESAPGLASASRRKEAAASAEPPPSPAATGKVLVRRKLPERDARSLGLGGLRRSNDEIVALKCAGERSIHGKRKLVAWLKREAVAKVGEANEAAHLVVASRRGGRAPQG